MARNSKTDVTLVTCPQPGDFSPLEAAIMDACNEMHEAREQGDTQGAERVGRC